MKITLSKENRKFYEDKIAEYLNDGNMGQRIHNLRKENNLTLEELGQKIGVQSSAVSKWEKNRVTNIPSEKVTALAKVFGCTTDYLLYGSTRIPAIGNDIGEVIDLYSRITPEQRNAVLNLLRSFITENV